MSVAGEETPATLGFPHFAGYDEAGFEGGAMPKSHNANSGLVRRLREAIRNSDQSLKQLGDASGIGADRLSRFLRAERDLTLTAAEKVCAILGLDLTRASDAIIPGLEPKRMERALRDLDAGKGRPLREVMAEMRRRTR
jgi:transcriptional regulator with XRE-family HTH domain